MTDTQDAKDTIRGARQELKAEFDVHDPNTVEADELARLVTECRRSIEAIDTEYKDDPTYKAEQ